MNAAGRDTSRVAVVTGGASGIGLGICHALARAGHRVAMLDVQEDLLAREGDAMRAAGHEVLAITVDVVDREGVEMAYATVRERLGPIGIVVANAAIARAHDFATLPVETWARMLDVNLTGVFHTIQAALPDMTAAGWGRIVATSSWAGQAGAPDRAHYACTKGGVIALVKALGAELARHGITVNSIAPAVVDTPLLRQSVALGELPPVETIATRIPIARAGTPDDIGHACAYLVSEGASYVTGQVLAPNGGVYM